MNRRVLLAFGILAVLIWLAGCASLGGATTDAGLHANATYDWDTDADVTIDLADRQYTAIYRLENQSTLRVYQSTRYGTEHPVVIRSLQFRYSNGTVVNASAIDVRETRSAVYLELPAEDGRVAYTAPKQSKRFSTPVLIEGSWEVLVPPDHRVDNVVLSTVRPGGYETTLDDDRVHITWESVTSRTVRVEYYLARDLYLFVGLVLVALVAGGLGLGYVYRQILVLRREREEYGLNLDAENDGEG